MLQYKTIDPGTLQLLKSLQAMPVMFEETDWDSVKVNIREALIRL